MLFSEGVDFCVGRNSVFKTGALNGTTIPPIKFKSSKNLAVAFDRKKTPINPPACNSGRKLQQIYSIVQIDWRAGDPAAAAHWGVASIRCYIVLSCTCIDWTPPPLLEAGLCLESYSGLPHYAPGRVVGFHTRTSECPAFRRNHWAVGRLSVR
jgi:hypothetical protein